MDYRRVTGGNMVEALETRIGQLEGQHYSNEVYKIEARAIGDKQTLEELETVNKTIERQIQAVVAELEPLVKALQTAEEDEG